MLKISLLFLGAGQRICKKTTQPSNYQHVHHISKYLSTRFFIVFCQIVIEFSLLIYCRAASFAAIWLNFAISLIFCIKANALTLFNTLMYAIISIEARLIIC